MNRRRNYFVLVVGAILMIAAVSAMAWGLINKEWVADYIRGMSYEPVGEMAQIRDSLKLTERGQFLFKATQPTLQSRESFNSTCRTIDTEIAVLGCYTGGNIYIYNITADELAGIRELTTAHELLHAVWARLSESEKAELKDVLNNVYHSNSIVLKDEIETYDESEQLEELYVRAGTEIANLPESLEKHYATIFTNQDMIVRFYDSYITVFREIESEMNELLSKIETLSTQIDNLTTEYEHRADQLNADTVSFNACAAVQGCISSEAEFYARRSALITEQNALNEMYDEINNLISQYNTLIEEYNTDVTRSEQLNQMINSNLRVKEIE